MKAVESVGTKINQSVSSVVARKQVELVDLDIALHAEHDGGPYWAWVFDVASVEAMSESLAGQPKIVPVKLAAGQAVSWAPPTKWTPFTSGIVVFISTSDTELSLASEIGFNIGYHLMYNNGANTCCGA